MSTFLLVDGHGLMHRAYHALPPFQTKDGIPTNVVFGFFSMIHRVVNDFNPQYLLVFFDTPKPTFRKKIFENYQIQRPKTPDEFKTQIPLVKKGLQKGKICYLEKEGYEADDLIGTTIAKINDHYPQKKIMILSGDRDIFQLLTTENIFIVSPQIGFSKSKIYDAEEVKKKFYITPEQIPDFKALAGDPSDNYPGAKGIGPKTAASLLKKFKNIETLLKNLDQVDSEKIRKIIEKEKENILLGKKLAQIVKDVPIEIDLEKIKFNGFDPELKDFFLKLEIRSLAERFFGQRSSTLLKKEEKKKEENNQLGLFQ